MSESRSGQLHDTLEPLNLASLFSRGGDPRRRLSLEGRGAPASRARETTELTSP